MFYREFSGSNYKEMYEAVLQGEGENESFVSCSEDKWIDGI